MASETECRNGDGDLVSFNKGDKVKCLGAVSSSGQLEAGNIYTVTEVKPGWGLGPVVFLDGVDCSAGYFPARFEKVVDTVNTKDNVIELNGKKYKVENIPGKGDCLVPVPDVTYKDVVGKILKFDANPKSLRYVIKGVAKDEVYVICLSTGGIAGIFQNHSKLDKYYTVVADSVSEAVKNGLIK